MGRLEGRTVLITGASSGIGRATALLFGNEGASLAIMARNTVALEAIATQLQHRGCRILVESVDLLNGEATRAAVAEAIETFGRLDIVVHAAGTNIPKRALATLSPSDWEEVIATNLTAAYHVTQSVVPHMRRQNDGLIIYVSSYAVQRPDQSGIAYQASKHGLVGLAHGTFEEERQHGIRTTVLYPGLTDTAILNKRPIPPHPDVLAKALRPEDIAEACLFVASLPPRVRVPELQLIPSTL